ncbi:MAG TPA: tetratricopeptide repeat protein [Flavobacteriales bacterium]|nr:tetratricopeptide repeat protein [Flavobacteriales bacterium]HRE95226.1 tetratricopeptide repeat protein [Flavobacteriales bacterium]
MVASIRIPFSALLFLFVLNGTYVRAQSADEILFETLRKKVKLDSYYDSASVFRSGEEAIKLARKLNDRSKEAEILVFYGNHFYYSHNFPKAKEYFTKANLLALNAGAKSIERLSRIRLTYLLQDYENESEEAEIGFKSILKEAQQNNDPVNIIECYNALAMSAEKRNDTQEAFKNYMEGLRVAEKNQLSYYTAVMLNNIGLIKLNNGEIDEALEDFNRGLELAREEKNPRLAGHLQNNIGLVYIRLNKNDEALAHFRIGIDYAKTINHPKEIAVAYINFSSVLNKIKRSLESLWYLDSAINVMEKNNMKFELSKGYLGKAQVLTDMERYDQAKVVAQTARDVASANNNLEDNAFAHLTLHRIYEKMKLHELALKEYKTFRTLEDSLQNSRNTRAMKELRVQYEVEKKDILLEQERNKATILEQENKLRAFRVRLIVGGGVLIVVVVFIVFYLRNQRNLRKEQQKFSQQLISDLEKERARIARDLHDDIGQSLSAVKSKLTLLAREGERNAHEMEKEIGKVIEQTREISRSLYPSYLEKIGLTRSVARLMEIVQKSTSIECSFDICEEIEQLSLDKKTHLYRILQECVNNTIKHSGAAALKISIEVKDDDFELTYRDNGKGIQDNDETKGMGFLSIKERARMLGGEMEIGDNSRKGFRLIITFNMERNRKE